MSQETYSTVAPECPYCGYQQSHDGGSLYDEDLTEMECGSCERAFEVSVFHSTSWTCTRMEPES